MALNRQQMLAVIEGGGSVLYQSKLHVRVETLPSAATLAATDTDIETVSQDLDAQIERLNKQKADLKAKQTKPKSEKAADSGAKKDVESKKDDQKSEKK